LVIELRTNLFFSSVQTVPVPPEFDKKQLGMALEMLGTARSPNAARVFESLVASLKVQLDHDDFATAAAYVRRELGHFCKLRPCHAQIKNVADELLRLLDRPSRDSPEVELASMRKMVEAYAK